MFGLILTGVLLIHHASKLLRGSSPKAILLLLKPKHERHQWKKTERLRGFGWLVVLGLTALRCMTHLMLYLSVKFYQICFHSL